MPSKTRARPVKPAESGWFANRGNNEPSLPGSIITLREIMLDAEAALARPVTAIRAHDAEGFPGRPMILLSSFTRSGSAVRAAEITQVEVCVP